MSNSERLRMTNIRYLYSLKMGLELPRDIVLPHERDSLLSAHDRSRERGEAQSADSTRKVRLDRVSSFLGASVVEYPIGWEFWVTLGSRVVVTETDKLSDMDTFTVDIVGLTDIYPGGVTSNENDETVQALPPWTPLARLIIGHRVGEDLTLGANEGSVGVKIESIDQTAIRNSFYEQPLIFDLES